MADDKKKGDFEKWHKHGSVGGNKKAQQHAGNSRTADKQNMGHGGRSERGSGGHGNRGGNG